MGLSASVSATVSDTTAIVFFRSDLQKHHDDEIYCRLVLGRRCLCFTATTPGKWRSSTPTTTESREAGGCSRTQAKTRGKENRNPRPQTCRRREETACRITCRTTSG